MPTSPHEICVSCKKPMRSRKNKTMAQKNELRATIPDLVFHTAHGLCEGCGSRERRASTTLRSNIEAPARPSWMRDGLGACAEVDPDLWYPEEGGSHITLPARLICGGCGFREECLAWALGNNEGWGIWAGTTPDERRAMLAGTAA
jgi:WhiB family redox-sensing transcriptional regulator